MPHITPFRQNGELDEEALQECVQFWLEGGLSGMVSCGSNGEAPCLSREERRRVIETVVDEVNGKVPVIAGTGCVSTRETIQITKDAKDIGVDAALVVTPFFFRYSDNEIYNHYRAILEAADLPILIYNVPKFTGISLEPSLVYELVSKYDNVIGVKDSSGSLSQIAELIRLVGDNVSVLAGTADVVLPTLMLGGKGAMIAVANVFPKECTFLYEAVKEGNYEEASKLQRRISYINEVLVKMHNQHSAIKEALKLRSLPGGYPRRPALPLESEERNDIETVLKTMLKLFSAS